MHATGTRLPIRLLPALLALAAAPAAADTIVVDQVGNTFQPQDIVVNVGDTVRWVHSTGNHTVTEGTDGMVNGDEAFHSALSSGTPTFEHTFDAAFLAAFPRAGNLYDYFCAPHFGIGMIGTVTVCEAPPVVYCTADQNPSSSGCLASISASSSTCPISGADDFDVDVSGAERNKNAIIFYGLQGRASIPFSSGTLCVAPPLKRTAVQNTAGAAACTGTMTLRINDPAGLDFPAATVVNFQGWLRDPMSAAGTDVSDAVEITFL